MQVFFVL